MTKEQYKIYLQSEHWQKFKKRVHKRYKCCRFCQVKENLNIHHLTYKNLGHEKFKDIVVVCQTHHYNLHDAKLMFNKGQITTMDKYLIEKMGTIAYFRMKRQTAT